MADPWRHTKQSLESSSSTPEAVSHLPQTGCLYTSICESSASQSCAALYIVGALQEAVYVLLHQHAWGHSMIEYQVRLVQKLLLLEIPAIGSDFSLKASAKI